MPSLHSPKSHSTNTRRVYLVCSILALASHSAQGYRRPWNPRSSEIHSAKTHRIVLHKADMIHSSKSLPFYATLSMLNGPWWQWSSSEPFFEKAQAHLDCGSFGGGPAELDTIKQLFELHGPWVLDIPMRLVSAIFKQFAEMQTTPINEWLQQEKLHTASERLVLDESDADQILELSQTKDLVGENFDKNEVEMDAGHSTLIFLGAGKQQLQSYDIIRYHTHEAKDMRRFKSAGPGLRQGRGSASDHRRCGTSPS